MPDICFICSWSFAATSKFFAELRAGTRDLHVDRRRDAEVQDLAHDVGRLEEERDAGKLLRQFAAELFDIAGGRLVAFPSTTSGSRRRPARMCRCWRRRC